MLNFFHRNETLGQRGERLAARHLRRQGYQILERNAKLGRYEIDIIALDGDTTAFVEVKTRESGDPVPPEENVGLEKQRRIVSAARQYISQQDDPEMYYRFDILAVIIPTKGRLEFTLFKDAFTE